MADLTLLSDLCAQAAASGAPRSFTAAIQHVSPPRRLRMNGNGDSSVAQSARVASYYVVHLADPTTSFFKLLCWGDALPAFRREDDHEGDDITTISVGDIVLFTSCTVKSFRGNVEAQYTRRSSVKLLYRRDRYFNTRDVRLKDLFPMIEWYKQKRHAFLVANNASSQSSGSVAFTPIRECREEALVNLRGTIHECKQTERQDAATRPLLPNSSDFDGVQLCEVMIRDTPTSTMVLNLWDHYADPRFASKVVAHRGIVEVLGVVISHNTVANRLLANTTPRTAFRFVEGARDDAGSSIEEDSHAARRKRTCATVAALEQVSRRDGHVVLQNVVIEHVLLERFLGHVDRVDAACTQVLVESYCTVCEQTLPLTSANTIPPLYASCTSRCRVEHGQSERAWRYRTVRMVLRDAAQGRLTVTVGDAVLTQLLGNIPAELLIDPQGSSGTALPFNPSETVAMLMNLLVRGGPEPQLYEAELQRRLEGHADRDRRGSLLLMNDDSIRHDEDSAGTESKTTYFVRSLSAVVQSPW